MSEPISKEDFIKYSVSIGYCARKTAEKYAEGKEKFTDDDYIEVYRLAQKIERRGSDGLHQYGDEGGKTTKTWKFYNGHEG